MNIFLPVDSGFDWWAKQLMKTAKFFGIDQAVAVRGYVVIAGLMLPGYISFSALINPGDVTELLLAAVFISVFHYFFFIRSQLREVERMIRDLEQMGTERTYPSGIEWSRVYRLGAVFLFQVICVVMFLFWPRLPSDPYSLRWLVWIAVPIGFHLYLMRHFDISIKTTCKGLIKSSWAKVAGVFAPKPVPAPQPTA